MKSPPEENGSLHKAFSTAESPPSSTANGRLILHVDMDAFYASIEQMDHPEYRGCPVVVGADPRGGRGRGVVSAASYEARKFGIHSALPISTAFKRCPEAVFLRPRFKRYQELSKQVMDILAEFSPLVEQISIDEAFLDCTGTEKLFGTSRQLGELVKNTIRKRTGLSASVGIATNKSLAKIASDLHKPDGLCICAPGREQEFMAALPLDYLWGAGAKTVERLRGLGFEKVSDIQNCDVERLKTLFGKYGVKLWELARGIDRRPVTRSTPRKSISQEITFNEDLDGEDYLEQLLFRISDSLTRMMRREGIRGRTVTLKIRLTPFDTYTRSRTLQRPVSDVGSVRDAAVQLFRDFDRKGRSVRLVGVGVSNLERDEVSAPEQLGLFENDESGEERSTQTDQVLDRMKGLYGDKVTRAAFLPPKK
jgi:nucleotidyltransferase/DNA polymerase involved in DNA repair